VTATCVATLELIQKAADSKGLRFLVIGGFAVITIWICSPRTFSVYSCGMGRKISTKNSNGRSPQIEPGAATCSHDLQPLDLPNEPEFRPDAPPCDPDAFIRRCASMLPQILAQPLFWKERAERRCAAEFDLDHPERTPVTYPAELIDELLDLAGAPQ